MSDTHQGRNYVIAGGSKGIGAALTQMLLSSGANVNVFARTEGELNGDIESQSRLTWHACDFGGEDFESAILPDTIHGVAYCPGTINLRSFRGLKLDDFRYDFEVNVMGAVRFLKGCLAGLKKGSADGPSSVVLFSTIAVGKGLSMHSSIAAAKGAVEGMTRSLAAELAPGIRVNCIAPALTDTSLAAKLLSTDEKRSAMATRYPLGRIGHPDDQASMANFLLGPQAGWITGQVIGVDGGMSTLGS